jgi:DNA-binding NarL/FixJ family response regulator
VVLYSIVAITARPEGKDLVRVLLGDDSTILGDRVPRMISDIAPDVEIVGQVHTSSEVAESVRALRPDVVILDPYTVWGNGLEVLQEIKRNPPAPVVIIFTNYPFPQYRQRCLDGGADFFFDKSSEFDSLRETIEHLKRDIRYLPSPPLAPGTPWVRRRPR